MAEKKQTKSTAKKSAPKKSAPKKPKDPNVVKLNGKEWQIAERYGDGTALLKCGNEAVIATV